MTKEEAISLLHQRLDERTVLGVPTVRHVGMVINTMIEVIAEFLAEKERELAEKEGKDG